jgi:uncharacterized phage protein (TIGR02220 family)
MSYTEEIKKIIDNLNSVCGTSYKPTTKATVKHITARLKEGFELEDFYHVISFKNDQWDVHNHSADESQRWHCDPGW